MSALTRPFLRALPALASLAVVGLAAHPAAAQVPVLTGSAAVDFGGISPVVVDYDAAAPTGNFSAPTNASDSVPYDIYVKSDANYVYGLWQVEPGGTTSGGQFVNVYVSTDLPGDSSTLGFEVNNDDAFIPGGASPETLPIGDLYVNSNPATGTDEFAIPWSYFTTDPQNLGFDKITPANDVVQFRLSQAFGNSVAGGTANYGATDLGEVTYTAAAAPEPSEWAAMAFTVLGIGGLLIRARKRTDAA